MQKRLLAWLSVAMVVALSAPAVSAQDRPGWEIEYEQATYADYLNPCTGTKADLYLDIEQRIHVVERPNDGWREQGQMFAEVTWGNGDWHMARRLISSGGVNAQGSVYDGDFPETGQSVGSSHFGWVLEGPDGGRWRLHGFSHAILVDGEFKFLKEWGGEPDQSAGEDVCVRQPRS